MNVERLKDVVAAIKAAPPEQFDMTSWKCGSVACAVGWYVDAHPDRGLSLVHMDCNCHSMMLTDGRRDAFPAVAKHFDITTTESLRLFDPESYADDDEEDPEDVYVGGEDGKAIVIARIEAFIAKGGM